jgi:hypothetical protein
MIGALDGILIDNIIRTADGFVELRNRLFGFFSKSQPAFREFPLPGRACRESGG